MPASRSCSYQDVSRRARRRTRSPSPPRTIGIPINISSPTTCPVRYSSTLAFSPEVHMTIVGHVRARGDLARLCRVSRAFRAAAEPALYNTLALTVGREPEEDALLRTLAGAPALAGLMDALSVRILPNAALGALARVLRAADRLRFLDITGGGLPLAPGEPPPASIFEDTSFQLRTLTCDMPLDLRLFSFLARQDAMEDLTITGDDDLEGATEVQDLSASIYQPIMQLGALPALHTLECAARTAAILVRGRCIRRLHAWVDAEGDFPTLTRALRSIPVRPVALEVLCPDDAAALSLLYAAGPETRYMGTIALPVDGDIRSQAYALLFRLKAVETLAFDVSCWQPLPTSHRALRALASEIRIYATRVRRVVFHGLTAPRSNGWLPSAGRASRRVSRALSSPFASRAPSPHPISRASSPRLPSRPTSPHLGLRRQSTRTDGQLDDEGDYAEAVMLTLVQGLWTVEEDALTEQVWREH